MAETKRTNFAEMSEAEQKKALAARTYVLRPADWEKDTSPEYGGQSDILILQVGEAAGPFTYVGSQPMATNLGDTTVHTATTADGETLRMPISASFGRALDQANVKRNDKFIIKRFEDVEKKAGKGKGQTMQIYAIKVIERAPVVGA